VLDPAWRQSGVQVEVDLPTQLQILISRGEGVGVEFKRQLPGSEPQNVIKTVAAFANGEGGAIIFGVDNDGQIIGLDDENLGRASDRVAALISDWVRPSVNCSVELVRLGARALLLVSVPRGGEPPYGVGTSDRKLVY
jgi:predicted HTH transcriptional regulator